MKTTIRKMERRACVTDFVPRMTAHAQLDFARLGHVVYGEPGDPEPKLEDFQTMTREEWDAEMMAVVEKVYAEAAPVPPQPQPPQPAKPPGPSGPQRRRLKPMPGHPGRFD
jgi:hypothetical protein